MRGRTAGFAGFAMAGLVVSLGCFEAGNSGTDLAVIDGDVGDPGVGDPGAPFDVADPVAGDLPDAVPDAVGDVPGDLPADVVELPDAADVADAVPDAPLWPTGRYLPYVQDFDKAPTLAAVDRERKDGGSSTAANWSIATTAGDLGPDGHLMFSWTPTVALVKTVVMTPPLDGTNSANDGANTTHNTTLQFRMAYNHQQPGATVKIRVLVSTLNDFFTAGAFKEVFTKDATADIPYDLYSFQLPSPENFTENLQVGFMLDTGSSAAGSADLTSLEIDDVKVAAGVPSRIWKVRLVRCTGTAAEGCNNDSHFVVVDELDAQQIQDGTVPTLTAGVCDWYRVFLCMYDQDASQTTWNYSGFPSAYIDGPPMGQPSFIQAPLPWGENTGCSSFPGTTQGICNSPLTGPGYYVCALGIKPDCCSATAAPDCAVKAAGMYHAALVAKDEDDPGKVLHSPFESRVPFDLTMLETAPAGSAPGAF